MIDTAGAQRVLTLITTDMDARQRLLAHYRGDEDPVSALRELLDPAQPSVATMARLERAARLQSVAYGRAGTTAERETAAQAQDELAWDRAHAADIREAIEEAVAGFLAEKEAGDGTATEGDAASRRASGSHAHADSERRTRRRSVRALWLVPAVLAALVIGVVVGVVARGPASFVPQAASTHPPTPKPTRSTVFLSKQPIDTRMAAVLTAITDQASVNTTADAERWFIGAQSANDRAIPAELLGDIQQSSMRLIISNRNGTGVWIGKPSHGGFCIFDFEADGLNSDCTATSGFDSATPLEIQNGANVVLWDGRTIIETVPSTAF
ncbi:MAG TPA: hypothetical protein VGM94_16330 [Galbitalea sp.]|jgi:hypothetical protein